MSYKSINDEEFEQEISLADSYKVMLKFIEDLHERGELETGTMLGFIGLGPDGTSADPAQIYDYLDAVKSVTDNKA